MFATPHEMTRSYMRDFRMTLTKQDHIDDAIEQYKKEALDKLAKIVDVFYLDAIALTIASGYENEDENAIEIVNRLNLTDKHIAALLNDQDQMQRIFDDEAEEQEEYESTGDY